jgi:hypothetical protein
LYCENGSRFYFYAILYLPYTYGNEAQVASAPVLDRHQTIVSRSGSE